MKRTFILAFLFAGGAETVIARDERTTLEQGLGRIEARLDALEKTLRLGCRRSEDVYGGRREVMISIGGKVLRFLEIRAPGAPVVIGLDEEKAAEWLQQVQKSSEQPILPRIFRSVPAVARAVSDFFFQDRPIDPGLYADLTGGADAQRVSYQDARRFIEKLNVLCAGRARFDLPTEEQFLVAALLLYDPLVRGLKPCSALTEAGPDRQLAGLLGNVWQLTRSPCLPFGEGTVDPCPEGSYVRKGGTAGSANPLDCLPQYRSAAPESVAQSETSFRLVLVE